MSRLSRGFLAAALCTLGAGTVAAETLGQIRFDGPPAVVFDITDRLAGHQTAWGGFPGGGDTSFGMVGDHPDGTMVMIRIDWVNGGVGHADLVWSEAGADWSGDSRDGLRARITLYDATTTEATIRGTIEGPIANPAGERIVVRGTFEARLPHFDFAPTPGP